MDGISCDALVVSVFLLVVLSVGPCHFWQGVWWVELVGWFAGPGGAGRPWCRRVLLVMLMVGVVQVIVLLMPLAWVL